MVIAIIAALVAILLPALAKARKTAMVIKCGSNVKQLGAAWSQYWADHDGWFPLLKLNAQWYYAGKHPSVYHPIPELENRPLNPYVGLTLTDSEGLEVFECTEDGPITQASGSPGPTKGINTFVFYGNSYPLNTGVMYRRAYRDIHDPGSAYFEQRRVSHIKNSPSWVGFLGDAQWTYASWNAPFDASFHNKEDKVNVLFLDGHVKFVQILRDVAYAEDYTFSIFPPGTRPDHDIGRPRDQ